MLSDAQIADFRRAVTAAQGALIAGVHQWITLADGPLAGLAVRVASGLRPGATVGWCCVTARGPVAAYYRLTAGQWRFAGYEAPGRRESGRVA